MNTKNDPTPIHYISTTGLEINTKKAIENGDLVVYTKNHKTKYIYKGADVTIPDEKTAINLYNKMGIMVWNSKKQPSVLKEFTVIRSEIYRFLE